MIKDNRLLFTPFTVTFANPFKIRFREWDLLTPESFSYGLRNKCTDL